MVLIVYVDDIILIGNDETRLTFVKKKLADKDLITLKYFLGMLFVRPKSGILVGKLIYLSHTHPDVAFPVSMVSQDQLTLIRFRES